MTVTLAISNLAINGTAYVGTHVTTPDNELLTHVNNMLNGLQAYESILLTEISTPANPAATKYKFYAKAGGGLYHLDSVGTETNIFSPGSDVLQVQVFS